MINEVSNRLLDKSYRVKMCVRRFCDRRRHGSDCAIAQSDPCLRLQLIKSLDIEYDIGNNQRDWPERVNAQSDTYCRPSVVYMCPKDSVFLMADTNLSHNVRKHTFMCKQRRFRSACAFSQSDQNLHWAHFR